MIHRETAIQAAAIRHMDAVRFGTPQWEQIKDWMAENEYLDARIPLRTLLATNTGVALNYCVAFAAGPYANPAYSI